MSTCSACSNLTLQTQDYTKTCVSVIRKRRSNYWLIQKVYSGLDYVEGQALFSPKTEFDCSLHYLLDRRRVVRNQLPTSCWLSIVHRSFDDYKLFYSL